VRKRYWVQVAGSILIGFAVGGLAFVATALTHAPLAETSSRVVVAIFAVSWITLFVTPACLYQYLRTNPIDYEETTMAHIESAKGTVKFNDECLEYDFITGVRKYPELQAKINTFIEEWETPKLIAEQIRGEVWITTLDAIPNPGIHRHLFGQYLQSLDWDEIAVYYIEQYEQEHTSE
jgi:hypothetical protein